MNNRHGLPIWDSDAGSTSTGGGGGGGGGGSDETIAIEGSSTTRRVPQSTRSILNGNLKKYQLNFDENEIDLLDFMMRHKEVIDDFIFEHSQNGSN